MITSLNQNIKFSGDPIADFYTAHPYPPAVENLEHVLDGWQDANRQRAEYHLFWPGKPYRSDLNILVAGCGTWQAVKYALSYPGANVIGIDVSATSLRETEKLKQKYSINNLYTEQLAIEKAGEMGKTFDLIICTGVLHHLANPGAGLRALASVLDDDGALYMMVYASYGRAGIYMMQEYCRMLEIGATANEINDLRSVIRALSPQHPLISLLQNSLDSYNADALADALLNPRDRAYSVPQLFAFLEENDLSFGRWYLQAPYLPYCGAIVATPHAEKLFAKPCSEQFAAMELWRGTMTRHSAIVYRASKHEVIAPVDLDEADFEKCVPIRLPHTICVTERLPPGAAGVLLNRSHQFHDLVLPIDAQQKKIFEAINGSANIQAILETAETNNSRAAAIKFIKKLWFYDQLVFKTF